MWRLVLNDPQVASLSEIETYYSWDDVVKANEALDIKEEVQELFHKKNQEKFNKNNK